MDRTELLAILKTHFNESEVRELCFTLGIDYESLVGEGKAGKARALIEHMERHDRYDELVTRCRERAPNQRQLADMPLDHVPDVAPLPPGSLMPLAPNPLFVGREGDLMALARVLKVGSTAAIGGLAAATGLGGIGKTQLATEFAHRYGQYFAGGVFWLSFADAVGVPAAVAQCGGTKGMALRPDFATLPLDEQVALVQAAWQSPLPRLLIFDNCEDEALLVTWRPTSGGCRILVTSRRATWDASLGVQTHSLDTLPRDESIALLRKFRSDLAEDDPDLDAIAAELGDLPLTLHLAGSYLARYRNAITPAVYLAQLRDPALLQHRSLRDAAGRSPTGHDRDVARTFALSYDRLDSNDPTGALAIGLLARAAYFAPGAPFPRELLLATLDLPSDDPDAPLQAADALRQLLDLGLIEAEVDDALRLHRLLAMFVRGQTSDATPQTAVERAMLTTASRLNHAGYPAPLVVLQAHLRQITDRALLRGDERAAGLSITLGYHLKILGDLAGARPYYEQALAINRAVRGERHPDTAMSLNNLGVLLQALGDLAGARPYLEQALAISRAVRGERHPNTAHSLNNLGVLLRDQGDLRGAYPYFEQALAMNEAVWGERHPDTVMSLNNLGGLLRDQGYLARARPYLEQALAISRAVWGERHPDTAMSLNNLGRLLQDQGNLTGARSYFEQALAISRAALGERHPDTAISLNNLGSLLQALGDLAGARPYLEQALEILAHTLGSEHSKTHAVRRNLDNLLAVSPEPPPDA